MMRRCLELDCLSALAMLELVLLSSAHVIMLGM